MKKLCINLFGSPSSGKSVAASSLFSRLKKEHLSVVIVNEFPQECVIEGNQTALDDQLYVSANQHYRIARGYQHAQITITDSPILLGCIYNSQPTEAFTTVLFELYARYNNFNIFMELDHARPYDMVGRVHSFTESISIQNELLELLESNDIPFIRYNETDEDELTDIILEIVR